ncbi:ABC-type uncharacterized transport system auxiliary subunit [Rhodoblastus acidophilus]|uniref:ABC-type transport auxiliary lipoprotein family protein n=1 Tax=Rhodoblastus acidophilus TaxID=1074 RepID=UPI0012D7B20F|nr:ABC-type transport auxiliary lipoprotein family protein [Rhodoblastus acidophilus]MCW2273668.1 ABC-type uncharacterized transport system auxiliary subunit [Rhodoblastus acidophilus]
MTRAPLYVLALALALSGCAATPRSYDLSAAPGRSLARGTLALDIVRVEPPFDGDAIVIRTTDGLERLGGAQWADGLPRLARSRVAESLENAGWRVGDLGGVRLRVEIRRFEIDSLTREARVELAAQFAGGAARVFVASEPVAEISGAQPAMALDRAFTRVLGDLARWTVSVR